MPFINVKLSTLLSQEQEITLKQELGEAISIIPGKSESSLMLQFEENCRLWLAGSNEGPIVFVNVMLLGKADRQDYASFSSRVVEIFECQLAARHVYVKFEEVPNWFWN